TMKDVEIPTAISQGILAKTITVDGKEYSIIAPDDDFLASNSIDRGNTLDDAVNAYNTVMNTEGGLDKYSVALKGLGLENIDGSEVKERSEADTDAGDKFSDTGMVVVAASDAEILFNGATLSSANSTLTINGLTLNVLDKTDSELTVTVSKYTSAVYDAVKDFISEYNSILKAMNTSYNAATAKGYDVLTSEMKEEMTDDEIEKWESVVKSSLLRRDDTLSSLISSFRNDMMVGYTASDGKKYSLASLGIMTSSDYTENGILHIMGDEDDDIYGDSQNKLQSMLNKNPDLVMEIMTGITGKFYEDLQKKMRTSKYSSALTFYNDKQMTEQMRQYKKEITTWEAKLADMEERYYSQFTAMEKAMANLQSQQNSLAGFFG
ncbi:MAG: flagellar filament capping protein FliD, partial [Lachnospiraceae bacterium]|nr:flagellar filament capping protein FliD [Lachnospiraceae bacterium]